MTFKEFVDDLPALRDEAKNLFGEYREPRYMAHYIPARGYPGESPSRKERKEHIEPLAELYGGRYKELPEYLWYCVNCKKRWNKCFDTECELIDEGNKGWKNVLRELVFNPAVEVE